MDFLFYILGTELKLIAIFYSLQFSLPQNDRKRLYILNSQQLGFLFYIYTMHLTRSLNRQTNTCTLLILYLLKLI